MKLNPWVMFVSLWLAVAVIVYVAVTGHRTEVYAAYTNAKDLYDEAVELRKRSAEKIETAETLVIVAKAVFEAKKDFEYRNISEDKYLNMLKRAATLAEESADADALVSMREEKYKNALAALKEEQGPRAHLKYRTRNTQNNCW